MIWWGFYKRVKKRVGGWPLVDQPTSHTTVRTVPYTAVQSYEVHRLVRFGYVIISAACKSFVCYCGMYPQQPNSLCECYRCGKPAIRAYPISSDLPPLFSASSIASKYTFVMRSMTVGIPSFLTPPVSFGISTLLTGDGLRHSLSQSVTVLLAARHMDIARVWRSPRSIAYILSWQTTQTSLFPTPKPRSNSVDVSNPLCTALAEKSVSGIGVP